ncbi:MAG: hypothetical protein KGL39_05620 [Patescibacteria group bacterium]|nr:hypothetical protein [Patescibacteria group bacterium]
MPILGLTERSAAFPRIGVIRKGAPKPNDRQPGRDLEWFRFTSEDPGAMQAFADAYGTEPTEINVMFPYQTVDEVWYAWREQWLHGGLVHRCDGEMMVIWRTDDGGYSQERTPCPKALDKYGKRTCKPVGRLMVVVPELQRLAIVVVQTTSLWDILTLQENLGAAEQMRGDLRGIPFILRRRPRSISTPREDGSRVRVQKSLLSIEPNPDWVRLQLAEARRLALPGARAMLAAPRLALEAPADEESEEDVPEADVIRAVNAVGRTDADYQRFWMQAREALRWPTNDSDGLRAAVHSVLGLRSMKEWKGTLDEAVNALTTATRAGPSDAVIEADPGFSEDGDGPFEDEIGEAQPSLPMDPAPRHEPKPQIPPIADLKAEVSKQVDQASALGIANKMRIPPGSAPAVEWLKARNANRAALEERKVRAG